MGLTKMVKIGNLIAVFIMVSVITSKSYADTQDIYSIYSLAIDETADNEVLAKKQGLINAKREAFYKVLMRLTRPKDHSLLPKEDNAMIEQMILSTSLPEEKFTTGSGHYLAKMDVRFNPKSIRGYLRKAGISYAEAQSKPLIVLPVLRVSETTLLWEDTNQWFDAWTTLRLSDELVPIVMPLGDISDVSTISSLQASRGEIDKLQEISGKYGASVTLVTTATLTLDSTTNINSVEIFGAIQGQGWEQTDFSLSFSAEKDASIQQFLNEVAVATSAEVLAIWKQRNLLDFQGGKQSITVSAPLKNLEDWVLLRKNLKEVAGVRDVKLESMNLNGAMVNLEFIGNNEQLQSALAQKDLILDYVLTNNKWMLTRK